MRYERFTPNDRLAPYVEHFWLIEADLGSQWREEILVPNGRPTLLISLGDPGRRKDPLTGSEEANVSGFSGIGTSPKIIAQTGQVRLVAAQMKPFGPSALGVVPSIDRHVPLPGWSEPDAARALVAALTEKGATKASVAVLETWMEQRLVSLPQSTTILLQRAYALLEQELPASVGDWAARLGIRYSQLYRALSDHVGISPKVALMIARYNSFLGALFQPGSDGLAQLALLQGYYDQAHANRDFLRFSGLSPRRFRTMLNGIARMMHETTSDLSKKNGQ